MKMSMADIGKVYPTEIHLLKKEIEVQGELLNKEVLERKTEIDQLRLEIKTLKRLIETIEPGALKRYDAIYAEEKQSWNPELEKKAGA